MTEQNASQHGHQPQAHPHAGQPPTPAKESKLEKLKTAKEAYSNALKKFSEARDVVIATRTAWKSHNSGSQAEVKAERERLKESSKQEKAHLKEIAKKAADEAKVAKKHEADKLKAESQAKAEAAKKAAEAAKEKAAA